MKPKVLQSRPGLVVAVREGWLSAVLGSIWGMKDYCTRDWVGDSMFVKEMPTLAISSLFRTYKLIQFIVDK